jgi:hypothetical protein
MNGIFIALKTIGRVKKEKGRAFDALQLLVHTLWLVWVHLTEPHCRLSTVSMHTT